MVGGCSQTARVGEGEMGGHEEVRQVVIVDFASDGSVAARGAGVLQHGFVVLRVDPNYLNAAERSVELVVPR